MKEMTMLDLSTVDLGMLAMALEDHSTEGSWWIDAETGEVWYHGLDDDGPEFDPAERDDARRIDPLPSREGTATWRTSSPGCPIGGRPIGEGPGAGDAREVAAAVAADLHRLYGERLVDVVLYGSHARGDAHPDSDVDLAVILDHVASRWEELRRMDDVLWRHTLATGLTVSATPISRATWAESRRPLVRAAKAGGVRVG
jgi:predicted nucleotidyltransferase